MRDSELIDWEQLEMIFGEEEEEFDEEMGDLFREFIEDGRDRLVTLKGTVFDSNRETIARESHRLKGSSSNFGFTRVATSLANIEDNIETISPEAYQTSLTQAEVDFFASIKEVEAKYDGLRN
ncbi:MAG: Hpt domain-containing protein [Opitutales bacterium]|jgi:HPt (histidine-containing phosphotransfer) domain-containing protein|nr:Hpt domain-containing protein [Opitutales bacterium]MDG2255820.1 Hpt domain-containing protein [Opitutaceae bacterium]MBT5168244.1 Hpt domain-containing protein [Opitutales bacterium]MBT5816622.1 Hpt domain-containing protein [Opitutales bacterium]MBT6378681.1 Hpt domain-containing protein [Opitutales bacterium]